MVSYAESGPVYAVLTVAFAYDVNGATYTPGYVRCKGVAYGMKLGSVMYSSSELV